VKKIIIGLLVALAGVGVHMVGLALIDRLTTNYPSIADPILARLPFVSLFGVGEVIFIALIAALTISFFRSRPQEVSYLLIMIGIYYALRGVFLFLMPIGSPLDAPPVDTRFHFYPYAGHAYFPGGHVGIMLLLAMMTINKPMRWVLIIAILIFGFGSMLTRAHYSGDILGGLMLGYVVYVFSERNIKQCWAKLQL